MKDSSAAGNPIMNRVRILYQGMVTWSIQSPITSLSKHSVFTPTLYLHTTSNSSVFGHTIQPSNIITSPYADIEYSPLDLYSHVFQDFSKYGSKTALVDGISGQEYSFNQIDELTRKFSSGLNRLGFNQHDVLSIVAPNSIAFPIILFGVIASGGVLSTCNPTCTADELSYQLKNSDARFVATTSPLLPTVTEAVKDSTVEKIIVIDGEDSHRRRDELVSFKSLLEDSGSLFNPVSSGHNDTTLLPYSSGTTGLPKGVMLTHQNITSNLIQLHHPDIFDLTKEGSCLVGVLPFVHLYGMIMLMASLCYGSRIVVLPKFIPELFLTSLQNHEVNLAHLVPPLVLFLAKHPLVERYNLSSLDKVVTAAASVSGEIVKAAQERIGCRLMCQCYGLTEACVTHVMADQLHMAKPDSIGPCIRSMASKIVSPESGVALGPGEKGELLLKGPNVMKGYLNRPDATKLCFTEDGWLRTGDIGETSSA